MRQELGSNDINSSNTAPTLASQLEEVFGDKDVHGITSFLLAWTGKRDISCETARAILTRAWF